MASGSQCLVPVGTLKAASTSFCAKTTTSSFTHGDRCRSFNASDRVHCAGGLCLQKSSPRATAANTSREILTATITWTAVLSGAAHRICAGAELRVGIADSSLLTPRTEPDQCNLKQ